MEYPKKPSARDIIFIPNPLKYFLFTSTFFVFHYSAMSQCVSVGPLEGTSFTIDNSIGAYNISSPSNAGVSDNNRASASAVVGVLTNDTHYLVITGFGFNIPLFASICGATIEIERRATGVVLTAAVRDNEIKLVKGGAIMSENKAKAGNWPTSDALSSYGNSSDLWGTTLTRDDVNSSGFGIAISAKLIALISALPSAQIDNIRITVHYQDMLPIVLEYFKSSRQGNKAILEWKTSEEEDRGVIIIQRSTSSRHWEDIDTINTYAVNVNKVYRFEDVITEPIKHFYRLKIIDNSGTFFSEIRAVDNRDMNPISIYPNPVQSLINIKKIKKGSTILLINSYGQLVNPVIVNSTGENVQINVQHLQKGFYNIIVNGLAHRFLKN